MARKRHQASHGGVTPGWTDGFTFVPAPFGSSPHIGDFPSEKCLCHAYSRGYLTSRSPFLCFLYISVGLLLVNQQLVWGRTGFLAGNEYPTATAYSGHSFGLDPLDGNDLHFLKAELEVFHHSLFDVRCLCGHCLFFYSSYGYCIPAGSVLGRAKLSG